MLLLRRNSSLTTDETLSITNIRYSGWHWRRAYIGRSVALVPIRNGKPSFPAPVALATVVVVAVRGNRITTATTTEARSSERRAVAWFVQSAICSPPTHSLTPPPGPRGTSFCLHYVRPGQSDPPHTSSHYTIAPFPEKSSPADNLPAKIRPARRPPGELSAGGDFSGGVDPIMERLFMGPDFSWGDILMRHRRHRSISYGSRNKCREQPARWGLSVTRAHSALRLNTGRYFASIHALPLSQQY